MSPQLSLVLNQSAVVAGWIAVTLLVTWTVFLARPRSWFKGMWDGGWMLSKVAGLLAIPYCIWLLNFIPGASVRLSAMVIAIVILIALWIYIIATHKVSRVIPSILLKRIILLEVMLIIIVAVVIYFKGFNPRIIGTEKLMDIAFINAVTITDKLPPTNPWLIGHPINYYYFGQFVVGVWSLITTIPTRLLYNIWIAFIGAVTFQLFWVLACQFTKRTWLAFLGAVVTILGGNIHYVASFIAFWIKTKSVTGFTYWFANATRLIPFTINEYPIYSIVLGDLHAHYLNLPFFVAFLLFLSQVVRGPRLSNIQTTLVKMWETKINWPETNRTLLRYGAPFLVLGWLLGMMYMTNSWDTITGMLLFAGTVSFMLLGKRNQSWKNRLIGWVVVGAVVGVISIVTVAPFLLFFQAPVGGIGIVQKLSELSKWLYFWGGWLIIGSCVIVPMWLRWPTWRPSKQAFLQTVFIVAFLVVVGCEFIFVKDIFATANPAYQRANTVFKFYYQAWILVGLLVTVGTASLLTIGRRVTQIASQVIVICLLFIIAVTSSTMLAYTPKAFDDFFNRKLAWNLDGYAYLQKEHPADYEAIQFLTELAKLNPGVTLVEATKNESYSYYGRVSANTGIPTVMGWPFHIVQWHGGYVTDVADVNKIERQLVELYTSDGTRIAQLLQEYNVDLVYIGEMEYKHYETELGKAINTTWYQQNCRELFKTTYNSSTTFIFDCRNHD